MFTLKTLKSAFGINQFKYFSTKYVVKPTMGKHVINPPIKNPFGEIKKGPPEGSYYTLDYYPSKQIARDNFIMEKREPVSAYYSLKIKNQVYHVFNAARMPLGRMSARIAYIIMGKNSPLYKPNVITNDDVIVIVNAAKAFLTGKKLDQKIYRSHSSYPGNLKETSARHYLEKDPEKMLILTIKGMLPKNKMRREYIKKIKIYSEGGHDLHQLGLPQFSPIKPIDYNKLLNKDIKPETHTLVYSSSGTIPEEFKDIPVDFSAHQNLLPHEIKKEVTYNRGRMKIFSHYRNAYYKKWFRRIRNKNYRYI